MRRSPAKADVLYVAALVLVQGFLFRDALFFGKGLVSADGILGFLPWAKTWHLQASNYLLLDQYLYLIPVRQFIHDQIVSGRFPLWNPYLGCGQPALASMAGAALYPINLLLAPLSPFVASGIAAFLKLLLAGVFTMMYMRRIGAAPIAALLSGLVFALCGFMTVWLGHPHVNGAILLPLLLYLVECQLTEPWGFSTWCLFALAFGVVVLGGHPPTTVHITIAVVLYFCFRLAQPGTAGRVRKSLLLLGSIGVGVLVAAAQVFPYLEYYRESSSALSSAVLARWSSHLFPSTMFHFLLPFLSGSPTRGFETLPAALGLGNVDTFNERTGYVGVLTLFLAAVAVITRRCRLTYFCAGLGVLSLLVIYGVPPWPSILRALPVLKDVNSVRVLLLLDWSLAVLAGLGLTELLRVEKGNRHPRVMIGFIAGVSLALLALWQLIGGGFRQLAAEPRTFLVGQAWVLAGGLLVAACVTWKRLPARWVGAVCVVWTAVDLLWFASGYNPSIPRDRYFPSAESIRFLQDDHGVFRVLGLPGVLVPNTAAAYGLDDVRGQDFMSIRRYEELITGKAGDFSFFQEAARLPAPFDLLNVKYVLVGARIQAPPAELELVHESEIAIYRYSRARERALVVFDHRVEADPASMLSEVRSRAFDPGDTVLLEAEPEPPQSPPGPPAPTAAARIVHYEPDRVTVEAQLPRPGFLLLLDNYFPGWRAYVGDREIPVYRADYTFRAVALPSGRSTVTFVYKPASFRVGVFTSLTVVASLSLLVIGERRFRPARPGRA